MLDSRPCGNDARFGSTCQRASAFRFISAGLFEGLELAVPAGPRRLLLEAVADDRAQSERLWFDRPQHDRPRAAARLLLRLSDGIARPGVEQRPQRWPGGEWSGPH